jgi:hypothetical protein
MLQLKITKHQSKYEPAKFGNTAPDNDHHVQNAIAPKNEKTVKTAVKTSHHNLSQNGRPI